MITPRMGRSSENAGPENAGPRRKAVLLDTVSRHERQLA